MPSDEDMEKRQVEAHKLHYDLFKHLTTLASGSVVLLSALLDKPFPNPSNRWLVGAAAVSFALSVLASLLVMFFSVGTTHAEQVPGERTGCGIALTVVLFGSPGLFVTGLGFLVVFLCLNL